MNTFLDRWKKFIYEVELRVMSEGWDAFKEGLDFDENPYPMYSWLHGAWHAGYFGVLPSNW